MRIIRPITFPEVVLAFLRSEIPPGASIIDSPDLNNSSENSERLAILGSVRGPIWEGIPPTTTWEEAIFTRHDLEDIKYMNWKGWTDLSAGTRSAKVAAERIAAGELQFPYVAKILAITNSISSGHQLQPMIFLRQTSDSTIYVLEGHHRLTAYFLEPSIGQCIAYLGSTESLRSWKFY